MSMGSATTQKTSTKDYPVLKHHPAIVGHNRSIKLPMIPPDCIG
jgi:hypothetical protein